MNNKPNKEEVHILPIEGLSALYNAAKKGADKYGPRNWLEELNNPEMEKRLLSAIHRHYLEGCINPIDKESGELHLHHIALNILILAARSKHRAVADIPIAMPTPEVCPLAPPCATTIHPRQPKVSGDDRSSDHEDLPKRLKCIKCAKRPKRAAYYHKTKEWVWICDCGICNMISRK